MKKLVLGLALIFILLFLAACGQAGSTVTEMPPTLAPTALPEPTADALPGDVLAVYHKTGCIDGTDQTLTIYTDGKLSMIDPKLGETVGQATESDLAVLSSLFTSPEFAQLKPMYQASGADLCAYEVTANLGDGKVKRVLTMDAAETPVLLQRTVDALETLRKRATNAPTG